METDPVLADYVASIVTTHLATVEFHHNRDWSPTPTLEVRQKGRLPLT
jgi:hypothetical protein